MGIGEGYAVAATKEEAFSLLQEQIEIAKLMGLEVHEEGGITSWEEKGKVHIACFFVPRGTSSPLTEPEGCGTMEGRQVSLTGKGD